MKIDEFNKILLYIIYVIYILFYNEICEELPKAAFFF